MRAWIPVSLALLAACARREPIPAEELSIDVALPAGLERVPFGQAFPLEVTLVWEKDLVPGDWDDRSLAPLVTRLEEVTRREDDVRVEERRRYRAYAFLRDSVSVPVITQEAVPQAGGPPVVASAAGFTLAVENLLDAENPGPIELPREPFPAPRSWTRIFAVAAGSFALLVLFLAGLRRRAATPTATITPQVSLHRERALERLAELRGRTPVLEPEIQAYFVEASAAVREYSALEFRVRACEMTTAELVGAPETMRALTTTQLDLLEGFLVGCDLVKFARHAPAATERERLLEAATRFVGETGSESPSA